MKEISFNVDMSVPMPPIPKSYEQDMSEVVAEMDRQWLGEFLASLNTLENSNG